MNSIEIVATLILIIQGLIVGYLLGIQVERKRTIQLLRSLRSELEGISKRSGAVRASNSIKKAVKKIK